MSLNNYYCQRNNRYKNAPLGKGVGGSTIYYFGCYFVSLCRELGVDPLVFNKVLVDLGLWDDSNYIKVDQLASKLPDIFQEYFRKDDFTMEEWQGWCDNSNVVAIAKVDARGIGGSGTHFVAETSRDGNNAIIFDPWYGDIIKVADRYGKLGNILSLRIFVLNSKWKENIKKYGGLNTSQPESSNMSIYKGLDLTNQDSMKVAVDIWDQVINQKQYLKKDEVEVLKSNISKAYEKQIEELNKKYAKELENLKTSDTNAGQLARLQEVYESVVSTLGLKSDEGDVATQTIVSSINGIKGQVTKAENRATKAEESLKELQGKKFDWNKYLSRKFILALLGLAIPLVNKFANLNLSVTEIISAIGPILAFIGFEGWTDHVQRTLNNEDNGVVKS